MKMSRFLSFLFRWKYAPRVVFAVTAAVFLAFMLRPGAQHSWVVQYRNHKEIERLEREVAGYRAKTEYYLQRRALLRSDRERLERFARERYHMVAPDEDVYIVDQ